MNPAAVLPTQTADITAELVLSDALPSGFPVQALVSESLNLLDGRTIQVPSFLADLVVVRDGAGRSIVPFRVRPSDTASQVALSIGYENLQIKQYPFEVRRGDLLSPSGGVVSGSGGFSVAIPAGALTETIPVSLSPITDPANLPVPIPAGFKFLSALQLSLGGQTLSQPAALRWGSASDPTDGGLVWVEVVSVAGVARLIFSAPGRYDAVNSWVETVPTSVHNLPLTGPVEGGLYLLLSAQSPVAFAKGRVLDVGGAALPGAVVTEDANAISEVSNPSGNYALPVPAAGTIVRSLRVDTGNAGQATIPSQAPGATATVDIPIVVTAPFVSSVTPDGSALVPLGLPIVFTLSEPLDPSTVNNASVTASGPAGAIVGTVILSAQGSQVTFTPSAPWPGKAALTVTLLSTVTDRTGYRLINKSTKATGDFVLTFSTIDPTPPGDVNPLLILTSVPSGSPSSVQISGGPGAACGGCTVTAINQTTQVTSTTQAAGDGRFSLTITATPTDVISIVIKHPGGGGEIIISPGPFREDGGRTAILSNQAADYVTPDRVRVTLTDGTYSAPATVRVTPILEAALPLPKPSLTNFLG